MRWKCLLLVVVAAGSPARADHRPPPSCVDDGTPFDPAAIRTRLASFAGKELDGRAPGSPGDTTTRGLIAERFRCLGLQPAFGDDFAQPFTAASGKPTANVVGYIAGETDDIIVVAAHHDHLGEGHLGANDNASGVVALLAIAQSLQQRGATPHRTIVFATFGDEEAGMIGSSYYVAHPPADLPLGKVVQVVNLDMVGSYASKGFVAAMGTFRKLAGRTILDELAATFPRLHVGLGGRARGSDFEPFCAQGIPYVFFWTPDARCYHATCDTVERIDEKAMVSIASLAGDLTRAMADSELDLAATQQRLGCGVRYR